MMILRRRMTGGGNDKFAEYVKLRTKNSSAASVSIGNILNNANMVSYVDKMFVDGIEITPTHYYDFGDSNYHDVYILYKDTTTVVGIWTANYTANLCDIPENYINFDNGAIRSHGSSGRYDTIIRAKTLPTFKQNNFIGWTLGHLWVPDNLFEDYKTAVGSSLGSNYERLHKLSDWTG